MSDAAVETRVKQFRAEKRERAEQQRRDERRALRDRAEREVSAERRAADEAARLKRADEVERELRATCTPTVTVRLGDGREVAVELGAAEPVARGTQIEAVRRLCWAVSEEFRARVLISRNAGKVAPPADALKTLLDNSAGLLQAQRMNLVTIREARP